MTPARIRDLDALRGLALLGILVVNIGVFASAYYGSGVADPAHDGAVDRAVRFAVAMVFEIKLYLVFSFLFGYSVTLQHPDPARMKRRLAALFAIGAAHAVLLFHGDILTTYAWLGLILLATREMSEARAIRVAVLVVAACAIAWAAIAALQAADGEALDVAAAHAAAARAAEAYRGPASTVIAQHVRELPATLVVLVLIQAPCALAMFLLGRIAGRRRLLEDPGVHRALASRALRLGLTVGLAGAAVYAWSTLPGRAPALSTLGLAIGVATAPWLAAAYVVLALRAFAAAPRLAAALAPAGRMAATNYVGQSLACALVFTGYGAGAIGRVPPLATLGIVAAIFAFQLVGSAWWLRHHAYGPLERLLRAATAYSRPGSRPIQPTGRSSRKNDA